MSHAGNQAADGGHFFRVRKLGLEQNGVGDVGHHHDDAIYEFLLVAHGAERDREVTHGSVAAAGAEFQVFDLMAVGGGFEGGFKFGTLRGLDPVDQPVAD